MTEPKLSFTIEFMGLKIQDAGGFIRENLSALPAMIEAMVETGQIELTEDDAGNVILRQPDSIEEGKIVGADFSVDSRTGRLAEARALTEEENAEGVRRHKQRMN